MTLEYIRKYYDVPAYVGRRVKFQGDQEGEIVGAKGQYIRVEMDGVVGNYHPTWEMEYLK